MKRLLLICTAATAIMLTACIHIDVDRPQPDKPVASDAGSTKPLGADGAEADPALRNDAQRRR